MPTVKVSLTKGDDWVKVADAGQEFLVDNRGASAVMYTFQTAKPPLTEEAYGFIQPGQGLARMGLTGALYLRAGHFDTPVVVTT